MSLAAVCSWYMNRNEWVRERDMQSSSPYHFGMIKKGGEPDYRWSLPSPCKETTGLPCPTSLTSHPSVKETRHQLADRVGVTSEKENATIGTRSGVNVFATKIDVNMCGVKDSYVAEGAENDVVWMSDIWGNSKCEVQGEEEFRSEGLSFRDRYGVKSASHSTAEDEYALQKDDSDDVRSQVSERMNLDEMECLTLDETRCDSTPVDMSHPDLWEGRDQKGITQNNGRGVSLNENGSKVENPRRLDTGYHVTRPHANLEYVVSDKTVGSRNVVWSTMGPPVCVPSLSGRRPQMEGDTYRPTPAFHRRCGRDERGDPTIVGQSPSDFMSLPSMSAVVNSSSRPSALRRSNQPLTNNFRSLQPMVMVEPVDRDAAARVNRRPVFDDDPYHIPQRYSNEGDTRDQIIEQLRRRTLMLKREMYDLRLGLVSDQPRERERSAVSGPRDIQEKSSRSELTSLCKSLPARRTSIAATTQTAEARTSEHSSLPTAETKPDLATKKEGGDGDGPPRCPPTVKTEAVVEKVSTTTSSAATTPRHSWIKLGTFNGRTAVEAFIRKFEVCSDNNGWSAEEKLNHLTCALTEPANQLLWEFDSATVHTCEDLIKRLRARYGGSDQTALYQTQLNTRRQKDGEEIGSLVQDIRRLMILAYPGPTTTHSEIISTRAFIDALRNKELAMKVREREPTSLDNAYNLAMKLEGYQKAELKSSDSDDRRPARVKAVKEVGPSMKELWKIVGEMQEQLRQTKELAAQRNERPPPLMNHRPQHQWYGPHGGRSTNSGQRQNGITPGAATRRCFQCDEEGHTARYCPQRVRVELIDPAPEEQPPVAHPSHVERSNHGRTEETEQTEPKTAWARHVTAFSVDRNPVIAPPPASREPAQVQYVGGSSCAYLDMWINEKSTTVLLDADGVNNLVPKSLVRPGGISGSARTIQTPGGIEIPVLGETILWCRLGDTGFAVRCLVAEQLSETVFGADWLKRHQTTYDFGERWLTFGSQTFRLRQPPVTAQCSMEEDVHFAVLLALSFGGAVLASRRRFSRAPSFLDQPPSQL